MPISFTFRFSKIGFYVFCAFVFIGLSMASRSARAVETPVSAAKNGESVTTLKSRALASVGAKSCGEVGCSLGFCKWPGDAKKIGEACADAKDSCVAAICADRSNGGHCKFLSDFLNVAKDCREKNAN